MTDRLTYIRKDLLPERQIQDLLIEGDMGKSSLSTQPILSAPDKCITEAIDGLKKIKPDWLAEIQGIGCPQIPAPVRFIGARGHTFDQAHWTADGNSRSV